MNAVKDSGGSGAFQQVVQRDGLTFAIDEYDDGSLVAEIDDRDQPALSVPAWLPVVADVSNDEQWTGAALAR